MFDGFLLIIMLLEAIPTFVSWFVSMVPFVIYDFHVVDIGL